MRRRVLVAAAAVVATVTAISACSSSKKSTATDTTSGAATTAAAAGSGSAGSGSSAPAKGSGSIKIGIITDLTGPSSSGFATTEKGIKAYVDGVNKSGGINGQTITYSVGDTTSTASGALTAAQKLIQSDKVFAIVEV